MRRTVALLAAVLAAGLAQAQDAQPKPGLWEMKMAVPGQGDGMTMQTCVGPQTSIAKGAQGRPDTGSMKCEKENVRKEADGWSFESVCKDGKQTITSRGKVTGKLDSQYRMDVKTKFDPPMEGQRESSMSMNMRYLGPCKPGMKPGDMAMEGMPMMPGMRPGR